MVLYEPTDSELNKINSYIRCGYQILVIDNSSRINRGELKENAFNYEHFPENIGLAKAYNLALAFCQKYDYDYLLILDQDSILDFNVLSLLDYSITKLNLDLSKYAIISLHPVNDESMKVLTEPDAVFNFVPVSSGSIVNVHIAYEIGLFDERMFIDTVDTEFALRALEFGYKTVELLNLPIVHQVGQPKNIVINGVSCLVSNHSALRRYYFVRNGLELKRMYESSANPEVRAFAIGYYNWSSQVQVMMINYESNKLEKLFYCLLGYYDFQVRKFGKASYSFEDVLTNKADFDILVLFKLAQEFVENMNLYYSIRTHCQLAELYYDSGNGFNSNARVDAQLVNSNIVSFVITCDDNIIKVRFDPCNMPSKIKLICVTMKVNDTRISLVCNEHNAYSKTDDIYIFLTNDPQFIFNIDLKTCVAEFIFEYEVFAIDTSEYIEIINIQSQRLIELQNYSLVAPKNRIIEKIKFMYNKFLKGA